MLLVLSGIEAGCGGGASSPPHTAAPTNLTYTTNPAVYAKGVAIANNSPTSKGGTAVSYSVTPPLPAGLSLDHATGVISGTPTAASVQATYTVTATNSGGSTSVSLSITVSALHTISGTVSGTRTSKVPVQLTDGLGGATRSTTTDAAGLFAFTDVLDGDYTVAPNLVGFVFDPPSALVTVSGADVTANFSCAGGPIFVVGYSGTILRDTDTTWSTDSSGTSAGLRGVWCSTAGDVWAVGIGGVMLHWDASSAWTTVASGTADYLNAVWGAAPDDIWVVGRGISGGGTIRHWNGDAWSLVYTVSQELKGVHGTATNDVWAVGNGGTLLHWNGSAWSSIPSDVIGNGFVGVWSNGANDVWAVGDGGTIRHWNGTAWAVTVSGTTYGLGRIWGSGPDDVWAAGTVGTLLRWDGSAWASMPSGVSHELDGLWGRGASDVWAAGSGDILHWDGTSWTPNFSNPSLLLGATCGY
jgi:hypothetical protein